MKTLKSKLYLFISLLISYHLSYSQDPNASYLGNGIYGNKASGGFPIFSATGPSNGAWIELSPNSVFKSGLLSFTSGYNANQSMKAFTWINKTSTNASREDMTILKNGNIGIKTLSPGSNFQLGQGVGTLALGDFMGITNNTVNDGIVQGTSYIGFNIVRQTSDGIYRISGNSGGSSIYGTWDGNINFVTVKPAQYSVDANGNMNLSRLDYIWNSKMKIYNNGQIKIGEKTPIWRPNYKLSVDGELVSKAVYVEAPERWSDYVFEKNYKLTPLEEVEDFVKANKHLPEIPSESELKEKGLNIGEMENLLLKKIEELTLYMIELKKENLEIKKRNEELTKKFEQIIK